LSSDDSKYHVPALEKGLDILEELSAALVPMSLSDLAQTLQRGRNELFRMLICLEARGYIVKDKNTGNYTLSLKLYQLAHRESIIRRLLAHALPRMHDLAGTIRECCHIAVLDQEYIVVLDQVFSPEIFNLAIKIGSRQSAIGTPSGRLLLAYMPEQQRESMLARNPDYQVLEKAQKIALEEKMKTIREAGYSYSEGEPFVGGRSVAVLVGNPEVGIIASLAVPTLMAQGHNKDLAPMIAHMQGCAAEITKSLGLDSHEQTAVEQRSARIAPSL
jgi:DNA-binding IclR family transcriptional regulator